MNAGIKAFRQENFNKHVCDLDQLGDASQLPEGTEAYCSECSRKWVVKSQPLHDQRMRPGEHRMMWATA